MRTNHVRHALARNEPMYGYSAGLGSLLAVETLSRTESTSFWWNSSTALGESMRHSSHSWQSREDRLSR